jgi:hypothetical protein
MINPGFWILDFGFCNLVQCVEQVWQGKKRNDLALLYHCLIYYNEKSRILDLDFGFWILDQCVEQVWRGKKRNDLALLYHCLIYYNRGSRRRSFLSGISFLFSQGRKTVAWKKGLFILLSGSRSNDLQYYIFQIGILYPKLV